MASSFKVSEFTGVANTTDDSLLMLSYTTDNGSTYATRKIRVADFLDDIAVTTKADLDVDDLEALTGAGAAAIDLGAFTGSTIGDNLTIKAALQSLETAVEAAGNAVTGGDGIDRTGDVLSVDISAGADVSMNWTTQSGLIRTNSSGSGATTLEFRDSNLGTESAGNLPNSGSAKVTDNAGVVWEFDYTGVSAGNMLTGITNVRADGSPAADISSFSHAGFGGGYPVASAPYYIVEADAYLEFASGKIKVSVLDEDNMASDSAAHLPTQQSVKAYVDAGLAPKADSADVYLLDGSQALTADLAAGGYKLTNLAAPTVNSDAATKQYVDAATSGQGAFFETVRFALESNSALDQTVTSIDGSTPVNGDRILAIGQTDPAENGIYIYSDSAGWSRSLDGDSEAEFSLNKTVYVSEGSHAGDVYAVTAAPSTLDVDAISFTKKQDSAGILDGSITTAKLAAGAVTNDKVTSVDASKLTGTLADALVAESNVTQHEAALSLDAAQIASGTLADARISASSVVQHQSLLSITESQISDLGDYATNAKVDEIDGNANDLITLSGVAENETSLGTFTGAIIPDSATIKSALQSLETEIESLAVADLTDGGSVIVNGDNVNQLIGSTSADTEPASYLFCVVDVADGSIKFLDKTFIEVE